MADLAELNEDFADVIRAFLDESVDFVVVGAHALAAHGVVRGTGDLDLLVRPTADNAQRVARALIAFGAPLASHGVDATDFARRGTVYQLGLPPSRIDVLTEISGVDYEEVAASSEATSLSGLAFRVPSRAALLRNKKAAGRPKDIEDARLLEALDGLEPRRTPRRS
jgi:hypothetical protein